MLCKCYIKLVKLVSLMKCIVNTRVLAICKIGRLYDEATKKVNYYQIMSNRNILCLLCNEKKMVMQVAIFLHEVEEKLISILETKSSARSNFMLWSINKQNVNLCRKVKFDHCPD